MSRFLRLALALVLIVSPARADWGRFGTQEWFPGPYFSAVKKAEAESKGICVVFFVEGSDWCDQLAAETFSDAAVAGALTDYVCIAADLTRNAEGVFQDARADGFARNFAVRVFPSIFFVDPEVGPEDLVAGFIPPASLVSELQRIGSGQGTLSALQANVARTPNDIQLRLDLAQKLRDFGDDQGYEDQMTIIDELDPEKRSLPMRSRLREEVIAQMEGLFDDEKGQYDTSPLETFLADEKHDEVLFDGWSYLAQLYAQLDKGAESRAAYLEAWKHVPDGQLVTFGYALATGFWKARDELSGRERRLALRVAERVWQKVSTQELPDAQRAIYLDSLACGYDLNGKRDQAVTWMRKALEHDPENSGYATRLEIFQTR